MDRRSFLGAVALGAVAGCTGSDPRGASPESGGPSPTDSPTNDRATPTDRQTSTPHTIEGSSATLEAVMVRTSIVTYGVGSTTHPDVASFADSQFLVADVRTTNGSPPDADRFGLLAGGERVEAGVYLRGTATAESNPLPIGIRVPVAEYDDPAVVVGGGSDAERWELPGSITDALAHQPVFDVQRFDAPDRVSAGEAIDVTLEVANTGERDGRFLAELGAIVVSDTGEVSFPVPAGETVTKTFSLTPSLYVPMTGERGDPLPVVLDWGIDRLKRTVAVDGVETSDG